MPHSKKSKLELISALQQMQLIPALKEALQPSVNLLKKSRIRIADNDAHLVDFIDLIFELYGTHITDQYLKYALPLFKLTLHQAVEQEPPQQKKRG